MAHSISIATLLKGETTKISLGVRKPYISLSKIAWTIGCAVAVGFFFIPTNGRADGVCSYDRRTPEYLECIVRVFEGELRTLRSALDKIYEEALSDIPPHLIARTPGQLINNTAELKQHFAQEQTAWNAYVTELCAYEGGLRGATGVLEKLYENHCLIRETKSRLEVLRHLPQEPL